MTGGYKIIDLYGLDLTNIQLDSTKIEKIFSDIESTYKTKALLFDNYKINGIEQNATFSSAVVKNSGFEITLGDYKLLIKTNSIEDSTLHLYMHSASIKQYNEGSYLVDVGGDFGKINSLYFVISWINSNPNDVESWYDIQAQLQDSYNTIDSENTILLTLYGWETGLNNISFKNVNDDNNFVSFNSYISQDSEYPTYAIKMLLSSTIHRFSNDLDNYNKTIISKSIKKIF